MCQYVHYISLKNLAGDKHSSLFCPAIIDEGEKFHNIDVSCCCYYFFLY